MDTMTIQQAFETMVWFIKQFQERGSFEDTGSLLHDLNQVGVVNDENETRVLWEEWCISVHKTQQFSGSSNEFPLFEFGQGSWDELEASSNNLLTILQAYLATDQIR